VGTSGGRVYAISGTRTGENPLARLSGKVMAVALSNDARLAAAASVNGDIALGDTHSRLRVGQLDTPPGAVAFDSRGSQVAFAGFGVNVYDASTGHGRGNYRMPLGAGGRTDYEAVVLAPGGKIVAAATDGVDQWHVGSPSASRPTTTCDCVADGGALSGDGRRAIFGTADGHMVITDTRDGTVLTDKTVSPQVSDHVYAVASSTNGNLFAAFAASGKGLIWDQAAKRVVWRGRLKHVFPTRVSFLDTHAILLESQTNESDTGTGFGLAPWLVPITR
jgi:WD40 repeat protein